MFYNYVLQLRKDQKMKWIRKRKQYRKKGTEESEINMPSSSSKDEHNNQLSTPNNASTSNGKPPMHSGSSMASFYMVESMKKKAKKRKLKLTVASSSSTGSDTPLTGIIHFINKLQEKTTFLHHNLKPIFTRTSY